MEIIPGVERRRQWRLEKKLRIVAEGEQPGAFAHVACWHEVGRGVTVELAPVLGGANSGRGAMPDFILRSADNERHICMLRRTVLIGGMSATTFAARAQSAPTSAVSDLAPSGKLRAAINYGNSILAQRNAAGALTGVSVDIALELGRRLGVPVELVPFEAAGKVSAAASRGVWDVAFLAIDPERAKEISFSSPYVVIEGAYLVRSASPLQTVESVDQEGIRIAVATGSAYDLFLSRALQHAKLERAVSTPAAADLFLSQHLDVLAGVKAALEQTAAGTSGLRLIPGRFMEIRQAMGVPAGRAAGTTYVSAFVEDIKKSGFVAAALKRSGQTEAAVAPSG